LRAISGSSVIRRIPWTLLGRVLFALGVAAVVYLSVVPTTSLPAVSIWDKAQHALAYFCVMAAGALGFRRQRTRVLLAIGLVALGGGLELLQTQLPMRQGTLGDAIANALGVIAGFAVLHALAPPRATTG
jgi:VanZ family protein